METAQKHFLDESKEQQENINARDLRELKMYYGSWDELRKVIDMLEDNEAEAAFDRRNNDY
jgi:hypothetical protein